MKNLTIKKAVIGTSGIGQVHIREILKKKITHLFLVGKRYKANRALNVKLSNKNIKIINCKNIDDLKRIKFKLISICSPMHLHYKHIKFCNNLCDVMLVEKPFIWFKKKTIKVNYIVNNILENNKNIFVNFPMVSLANTVKKKFIIRKKIKSFSFKYHTKGRQTYSNIPADLLPHALAFFITLTDQDIQECQIVKIKKNKFYWSCELYLNNIHCFFDLKQDITKKESQLSFSINKKNFQREQIKIGDSYKTYLKVNNKKKIKILNPMSDYLNKILKQNKNKFFAEKNKKIIKQTMYFSDKLINKI